MRFRHRLGAVAACLAFVGSATGCGLPGELVDRARATADRIDRESAAVADRRAALAGFLGREENADLRRYAESEGWAGRFDESEREIAHARELLASEIEPLLEADRGDDEARLREQLGRLAGSLDRAVALAREPAARAAFLEEVRERGPEQVAEARQAVRTVEEGMRALRQEVARASSDHPGKAEDLASRVAGVGRGVDEARERLAVAEQELRGFAAGAADLALLGDATAAALAGATSFASGDEELRTRIGELYRSYSKTLIDMKEEAAVEIGRTSWNESVDFPRETERRQRVPVSPEDLESLESWGDRPIASLSSFFGRTSLKVAIDSALWERLRVDPLVDFPRGDNAAEYWVGETQLRTFHRYNVVEGETAQESDWQEVSEEFYETHYDDLGMDIVAKPYGLYEDEALTEAAPPGLAYVGNPKYGRWEEDAQGRRRWSWGESFLFYYLIFGGPRHHYYYDDWGRWNRDYRGRRAWYGPSDGYGTYGSRTRKSARYAGSGFGRSGGFRRADASVRGAGPGGRGGGPGGGGK